MAAKLDRLKELFVRCTTQNVGGQYNIFVFVENFLWCSEPRGKKVTKFSKVDKKKSCN